MWTCQPLKHLSQQVIDNMSRIISRAKPYGTKTNAEHHFDALKRMLDRKESDYRS